MDLKVLIADDDFGMRLILRKIIENTDGFTLIGEAMNGEEAISIFESEHPDIVFLDIEMPILNGLHCAKKIADINPKTIIIFATAHNEFMSDAFEVYAFDYLIKPFKVDRVTKTLNRIKETKTSNSHPLTPPVFEKESLDKLVIKNKEGINFINTDDIILIQREDRSTVIYTCDKKYTTSDGLGDLEQRLHKAKFFRSHKSYIINLTKINKIEHYGRWTYIVKFSNTKLDALMTHKKYEVLESLFI